MESRNPPKVDASSVNRESSPSRLSRKPPNKMVQAPKANQPDAYMNPAAIAVHRLATVSIFAVIPNRARTSSKGRNTEVCQVRTHRETIVDKPFLTFLK